MDNKRVISVKQFLGRNSRRWITIKTIMDMKEGEELDVLCYDRNFYDLLPDQVLPADLFFAGNYHYTLIKGKEGIQVKGNWWQWKDGEKVYGWNDFDDEWHFHVEYEEDCWYPLDNDHRIPQECWQTGEKLFGTNAGKSWRELPPSTRLGWRGPMLPYKHVVECAAMIRNNRV